MSYLAYTCWAEIIQDMHHIGVKVVSSACSYMRISNQIERQTLFMVDILT